MSVQVATFLALATFASWHWSALVAEPPLAQIALALAIAGVGALTLAHIPLVTRPGVRRALSALVPVAIVAAALAAGGLSPGLMVPTGWSELAAGVDRGLAGLQSAAWPYDGGDAWARLVVVLAAPLTVALSAVIAFWPLRGDDARLSGALRVFALLPLLMLYGVAGTELVFGAPLLRGFLLLLVIAGFLWLPGRSFREGAVGAAIVLAVGVGSLPVASALESKPAWIDYREWGLFDSAGGISFDWTHSYGPMDWSRDGSLLLAVASEKPHYWKAETLDRFDGLRWVGSAPVAADRPFAELPRPLNPRWNERIRFTVRSLQTELLVGAGTTYRVDGLGQPTVPGGATTRLDEPLREGESYTVNAYVPDPSPRQLRAVDEAWDPRLAEYTRIELPSTEDSGLNPGSNPSGPRENVNVGLRGAPLAATIDAEQRLQGSPYARAYALARRLTASAPTVYDAVDRIRDHLRSSRYTYSEEPPRRAIPLSAFLFEDRVGYCQQFSGAMALLLRMSGIPARVASGFSPGFLDPESRQYEVRDVDAHSWVEVYFPGIGWTTFDPTPGDSPARSQDSPATSGDSTGAAGAVSSADQRPSPRSERERGERGAGGEDQSSGGRSLLEAGLVGLVVLGGAGAGLAIRARHRRSARPAKRADRELRELADALPRLGHPLRGEDTLLGLERRFARTGHAVAAAYVGRLRARRFGRAGAVSAAAAGERRALRKELTAGRGLRSRLRGLRVLPPRF